MALEWAPWPLVGLMAMNSPFSLQRLTTTFWNNFYTNSEEECKVN